MLLTHFIPGHKAYLRCQVYYYNGDGNYPAGPGLIFRVLPTPDGNVLKECHFHYKVNTQQISSHNCPYVHGNTIAVNNGLNDLLPHIQKAVKKCHDATGTDPNDNAINLFDAVDWTKQAASFPVLSNIFQVTTPQSLHVKLLL